MAVHSFKPFCMSGSYMANPSPAASGPPFKVGFNPPSSSMVGFKGSQFLSTGKVFAPYVPLFTTSGSFMSPQDFVSVQPMTGPTDTTFYMDFTYGGNKPFVLSKLAKFGLWLATTIAIAAPIIVQFFQ